VHLVGKDILRFHAVIWPAMLLAAGLELPRQVRANGWLLVGGEKMSKTKLTGISPRQITDVFGSDALRYFFLREISFGSDGSFSWESMAARYSSELADQLGNLASRVAAMVERYRGGVLPAPAAEPELAAAAVTAAAEVASRLPRADFQGAILAAMDLVRRTNQYVTAREPWTLAKDPARAAELDRVLYAAAECLRVAAVLLYPVMPGACDRLWQSLGAEALGPVAAANPAEAGRWGQLPAGATVHRGEVLFPRVEA
jgi:methionyl-tRNA synthetase